MNNKLRKILRYTLCASLITVIPVLSGCSHQSDNVHYSTIPASPIAALRAEGVQVIHLGDTYRLVVPSRFLFHRNSANLYYGSHSILNKK